MGFIENTLAFVFVLGVMIFVHELGHFLAARYFDVRVEAFAFGFGPRLFGFRRGDTDYKVCLLPLGGYVKMAGENLNEPTGDPGEFLSKPRWQRLIIAVMGPVFNFILAVLLPAGLFMYQYERYAFELEPATLGYVEPNSPADRAGIREGDTVVAINGDPTPNWEAVRLAEVTAANSEIRVAVQRDGERVTVPVSLGADPDTGIPNAGWSEAGPVTLGETKEGTPAAQAGIQPGDVVLSINGEAVNSRRKLRAIIQDSGGQAITIQILRGGEEHSLTLTPVLNTSDEEEPFWSIGVYFADYDLIETQLGFFEAFRESIDQNVKSASVIFAVLKGLVQQRMSPKSLEGPIGIARLSGEAARNGFPKLVMLMSLISLNLGIFNLLPIPILDGGVITLLLVEMVRQKDLSITVKERIIQAGLVFIMLLFAFVMYNDILKSLPRS